MQRRVPTSFQAPPSALHCPQTSVLFVGPRHFDNAILALFQSIFELSVVLTSSSPSTCTAVALTKLATTIAIPGEGEVITATIPGMSMCFYTQACNANKTIILLRRRFLFESLRASIYSCVITLWDEQLGDEGRVAHLLGTIETSCSLL
ncbi:hypothetical protein PMIN02_001850 [Paraphaeosphaeria minitans]